MREQKTNIENLIKNKKIRERHAITMIALIMSIIVMIILAGVSINAIVGDNGIITQAQAATVENSIANLEEYLQELYVNNYESFAGYDSKIEAFLSSSSYSDYFYSPAKDGDGDGTTYGAVDYVVDSDGHALYLIKKSALPEEIQDLLIGGDAGEGKYADYASLIDVYGVTSNLKVYYCSSGTSTIAGLAVEDLDNDYSILYS